MESRIGDVTLHWIEKGAGRPLVALHGAGVDHRDLAAGLETLDAVKGVRRIYPDLPGLGRSTAVGLAGNDDVVGVLIEFLEELDSGPALLVGHSYGGYLARGVAGRRPDLVAGLALLAPIGEQTRDVPEPSVVRQDADAYDDLDTAQRESFDGYFVVRTRPLAQRFLASTWPGTQRVDEDAFGRIAGGWAVDLGPAPFRAPTLIVAGRRDATVGFAGAVDLLASYPDAGLTVLADAGHALIHESPDVLSVLLRHWLDQAGPTT